MFRFSAIRPVFISVTAGLCLSGAAALAQSSNEPSLTIDGLSGGTVVQEPERQAGETYISERFSDWALRCIATESGDDPCQMYQLLSDNRGEPISELSVFRLPEGSEAAAAATIVVPLETALDRGLTIQVDEEPAKRYPFQFCNTVGCYARVGITAEEVEILKRGTQAVLTIVPVAAPDRLVRVNASLNGFTAAFEATSILNP